MSSFADDTAVKTGVDARTVRRDAARGERVSEDALDVIRGTSADKGVVLGRAVRISGERFLNPP